MEERRSAIRGKRGEEGGRGGKRGEGGSSEGTGWSDVPDCSQERRELPRRAVNT